MPPLSFPFRRLLFYTQAHTCTHARTCIFPCVCPSLLTWETRPVCPSCFTSLHRGPSIHEASYGVLFPPSTRIHVSSESLSLITYKTPVLLATIILGIPSPAHSGMYEGFLSFPSQAKFKGNILLFLKHSSLVS